MNGPSLEQTVHSALWAAYADALGFITELTDRTGLRRRAKVDKVIEAVNWTRLVGGRFGALVDLPAGCYSDDTQLRLATSRAISGDGHFDVEAFAKVELPVWLSYSLGAGAGTKAAAANLSNPQVNWFSNFFRYKNANYVDGGGNGAVMRIQPHVWASTDKGAPATFLGDVIRNAVCTHGHVRGIFGAAMHACALAETMRSKTILEPNLWKKIARQLRDIPAIVANDRDLGTFWLPTWEERSSMTFKSAVDVTVQEVEEDLSKIEPLLYEEGDGVYEQILEKLGGFQPATQGSGTKTVIAALSLAWLYRNGSEHDAVITAVNALESDTDTIATVAGAMIGAVSPNRPPGEVMDYSYIESEANRIHSISLGRRSSSFQYPDLMSWRPPKTQSDVVGLVNNDLFVNGLGKAQAIGEKLQGQGKDSGAWQWLKLDFGQTILAKLRNSPTAIAYANLPNSEKPKKGQTDKMIDPTSQAALFPSGPVVRGSGNHPAFNLRSLDDFTAEAIRADFDPTMIGRHVLLLSEQPNGIELAIAYVAIVTKAKRARAGRRT